MNTVCIVLSVLTAVYGWWLIPDCREDAVKPQAPYRALTGVIFLILALLVWP